MRQVDFVLNMLLVVYLTYHTIYQFKVYNSAGFSAITVLYSYHHYLISEDFHHFINKPVPICAHSPLVLLTQPQTNTNLLLR